MVDIPRYEDCSLRELYEVLNTLQADLYPEVYEALEKEIASRQPSSISELRDCYYALDRKRNPDYAARLIEQIRSLRESTHPFGEEPGEQNKYKTFWRRFWASQIDGLILNLPLYPVVSRLENNVPVNSSALAWVCLSACLIGYGYFIGLHAKFGQTVGKMLTGIKVVDKSEKSNISWDQAGRRYVVPMLFAVLMIFWIFKFTNPDNGIEVSGPALLMLYAWAITWFTWLIAEISTLVCDRRSRAVHDFIAGTVVVRLSRDTVH